MLEVLTSGAGDCVTGDRLFAGDVVLNTRIDSRESFEMRERSTRFIKESTIVWLVEQAGLKLCRVEGCTCPTGIRDFDVAQVVDGEDAPVGDREGPVRDSKSGRFSASSGSNARKLAR